MTFREFAKYIRVYTGGIGEQNIIVYVGSKDYADCPPHHFDSLDGAVQRYGDRLIDEWGGACYVYPDDVTFWLQ